MYNPLYIIPKTVKPLLKCDKPKEEIVVKKKSRFILLLLTLAFGTLGIHKFYLGNKKAGKIYLIFFWTLLPALWSVVEFIYYFFLTEKKLQQKIMTRTSWLSWV